MTDRKKPGVAFWAKVALVVVLAYPLSLGPVCWAMNRGSDLDLGSWLVAGRIYVPIILLAENSVAAKSVMKWYIELWTNSLPIFLQS